MRLPIRYNFDHGQMLYAVMGRTDAALCVFTETPAGVFYAAWSVPGGNVGKDEFVAQTWGDHQGLMSAAMFSTNWFERTGRTAKMPVNEVNEIWRLSVAGREWLAATTLVATSIHRA